MKFPDIHTYLTGNFMFKHSKNRLPHVFDNFFILALSIHGYNTRQSNLLYLQPIRLDIGRFSLRFQGSIIWNSLPPEIRLSINISKFKNSLKLFLLEKYTEL